MDDYRQDIKSTVGLDLFSTDDDARHPCTQLAADDPLIPECRERAPIPRCSARDRELLRNRFPVER